MARVIVNTVLAVLLMAALSTRCVFACFTEIRPVSAAGSKAHDCCHRGKSQPKPAKTLACENSTFEVQSKSAALEQPAIVQTPITIEPLPAVAHLAHANGQVSWTPPGGAAAHEILLI